VQQKKFPSSDAKFLENYDTTSLLALRSQENSSYDTETREHLSQ